MEQDSWMEESEEASMSLVSHIVSTDAKERPKLCLVRRPFMMYDHILFGPCQENQEKGSTIIDVAKEGGQKNPNISPLFVYDRNISSPSFAVPSLGLKIDGYLKIEGYPRTLNLYVGQSSECNIVHRILVVSTTLETKNNIVVAKVYSFDLFIGLYRDVKRNGEPVVLRLKLY